MAMNAGNLRSQPIQPALADRFDSWKEIAAYLRCSERTVRRWEEEGLPVHRRPHKRRAGIYAYRAELDAWWNDGHARLEQIERSQAAARRHWPIPAAIAASALLLGAAVLYLIHGYGPSRAPAVSIQSLAVLPLQNLSQDPQQEYFADGMTDALITDLAKIHALRVISRNSIMQYKNNPKPMRQIARELNVDAVVEGTVMRSGDRVRITAQLIEARKDRHLWADTYEGDLRDILSLQDDVAKNIAAQVNAELTPQERARLSNAHMVDPVAHQAYLRGLYELQQEVGADREKAIPYFEEAIAHDSNDPLPYAGLADAYYYLSSDYKAPLEVMPKARAAALKAVQLDDTIADAHASLGFISFAFDWDWPAAQRELQKALELDPNSAQAHLQYAEYLLVVPHDVDRGIQEFQRSYSLNPLVPLGQGDIVWFLYEARRYAQAIDEASKALEDDSPFLSLSYSALGRRDQALAVAERVARKAVLPVQMAQIASAYALAGAPDRARVLLDRVLRSSGYVCGFNVGAVYAALGDNEQAIAWLEKAYRDHST